MNETKTYKRYPAVRCWIHHLLNGAYSKEDEILYTIFGKIKRVRILATIVDKREFLNMEYSGEDESASEARLELDLDDGTGLIRATLWRVDPEDYQMFDMGDLVDIIGLIRNWKDFVSISPEIIHKVNNPNQKLLIDAEIIKRIQAGDLEEIPEIEETDAVFDEMTEEIDVDSLFMEGDVDDTTITDEILAIITKYSKEQEGISFDALYEKLDISEGELKQKLKELEVNIKIYRNGDVYTSYNI